MRTPQLYIARMEPYRLSDLDRFLGSIRGDRLVQITPIGNMQAGRDLEIIRIGSPMPLITVRPRARAPVGVREQLGRAGPDPAAAERRRRIPAVSARLQRQRAAHGEQGWRGEGADTIQPPRQGSQSRLEQAGESRARTENAALERWLEAAIAPAGALTWRWSCTTTAPGVPTSAARRFRSSIVISPAWRSSRSCCAKKPGSPKEPHQRRVPQQRHARGQLARALRHRRRRP